MTISHAEPVDGKWKHVSTGEYFGDSSLITPLVAQTVQVSNEKIVLSPSCAIKFSAEPYVYSMVFQTLLRQRGRSEKLYKYLKDSLAFDLREVKTGYKVENSPCANEIQEFFVNGDNLLVVASNTIFIHSRVKVQRRNHLAETLM